MADENLVGPRWLEDMFGSPLETEASEMAEGEDPVRPSRGIDHVESPSKYAFQTEYVGMFDKSSR